jgi:hypothetical protein
MEISPQARAPRRRTYSCGCREILAKVGGEQDQPPGLVLAVMLG